MTDFVSVKTLNQLKNIKYNPISDFEPQEDSFSPNSSPIENYIQLPLDKVQFFFIDSETDIPKLNGLVGEEFVGVDAEWRPSFN
jgi:hypothetical protein